MTQRKTFWGLAAAMLIAACALLPAPLQAQSSGGGGGGLSNLFGGIFSGPKPDNGAQPQAAPGSVPWSGEDGASGHPLMTAAAIRQAATNFDNCVASMWPDAARRNITQDNFQRFT